MSRAACLESSSSPKARRSSSHRATPLAIPSSTWRSPKAVFGRPKQKTSICSPSTPADSTGVTRRTWPNYAASKPPAKPRSSKPSKRPHSSRTWQRAKARPITWRKPSPDRNFEFSTEEIARMVNRWRRLMEAKKFAAGSRKRFARPRSLYDRPLAGRSRPTEVPGSDSRRKYCSENDGSGKLRLSPHADRLRYPYKR